MRSPKALKKIITAFALAIYMCLSTAAGAFAAEPTVTHSVSAMLYCVESDSVLYTKNENEKHHPGVLVKLMVAVVAVDEAENRGLNMESYFTASRSAIINAYGKHISMRTGEKFRLRELISAAIHTDADDAANVIAEGIADTSENFVALMNDKAKQLGMESTEYFSVNATYDESSYTTAADQIKLAAYAMQLQPLMDIAKETRVVIEKTNLSGTRYYGTTNYLISTRVNQEYYLSSANGLVCGSNGNAGYCAALTSQRDGLDFICVVLGADNSTVLVNPARTETDADGNVVEIPAEYKTLFHGLSEGRDLLLYGQNSFGYTKVISRAVPITDIHVKLGSGSDRIALMPEYDVELFVSDGFDKDKEITYDYVLDSKHLTAPVKAGTRVGIMYVRYNGDLIAEIPLVTRSNVEENGYLVLWGRVEELLSTPFIIVLIALTVFAAIFYVLSNAVTRQKKIKDRARLEQKKRGYLPESKAVKK